MKYKKLSEVPGPYYVVQTAAYKPIIIGDATIYRDKETDEPKVISGKAIVSFYLIEPGQDININLKYCVTWSSVSTVEAQYWLDLVVITTSKIEAGADTTDIPTVNVPACDHPS